MLTEGVRTEASYSGRNWDASPPQDLSEVRTLMVDILCIAADRFTERHGITIRVHRCGENHAALIYPWGGEDVFELGTSYVN